MSNTIQCDCGQTLRVPLEYSRTAIACPRCGANVPVPLAAPPMADGVSTQTCGQCGNLFPISHLNHDDGGYICRRCESILTQHAAAQKALVVRLIVFAFIAIAGIVAYALLSRESGSKDSGPIAGNTTTDGSAKAKDATIVAKSTPQPVADGSKQPATTPTSDSTRDASAKQPEIQPPTTDPPPGTTTRPAEPPLWTYRDVQRIATNATGSVLLTYRREGGPLDPNAKHELIAWDSASGKEIATLGTDVRVQSMAVSHDGKHALIAGRVKRDVVLRLIDVPTGSPRNEAAILEPWGGAGFAADSKTAWCLCPKEGIRIIQPATGKAVLWNGMDINSYHATYSSKLPVASVKCNSSGGQWIDFYNLASRQRLHRLQPREPIGADTLSPDGQLVALGFRRRIDVYDTRSWNVSQSLARNGYANAPQQLLISPDSRWLVEIPFGADGAKPVLYELGNDRTERIDAVAADMVFLDDQTLLIAVEGEPLKKVRLE